MYRNDKRKIIASIEARMTSSRLPGKVLLPILGKPALARMVERVKKSKYIDSIIIATTINTQDDPIVKLAQEMGVNYYRGSENDVLGRVLEGARSIKADIIVELTGDCPFADPALIDRGIEEFFSREVDYASNTIEPTFPNGFDVQVFPTDILARVDKETNDPIDRVHVSYYIYMHPEKFRVYNWVADENNSGADLRVTLDETADYELIQKIFESLSQINENFSASDVVQFLRKSPDLVEINKYVRQKDVNEG